MVRTISREEGHAAMWEEKLHLGQGIVKVVIEKSKGGLRTN